MALTKKQLDWLEGRTRVIIEEQLRKYKATLPELPVFGFAEKVAAIRAGTLQPLRFLKSIQNGVKKFVHMKTLYRLPATTC